MLFSPCCPMMVPGKIRLLSVSVHLFLRKGYGINHILKKGCDLLLLVITSKTHPSCGS